MTLPYILARRSFRFSRWSTLTLLLLNGALGILIIAQGGLSFMTKDIRHITLGIVCVVLGLFTLAMELVHIGAMRMYASFLFSFVGRGIFYLTMGCLTLDGSGRAQMGIGAVLVILGAIFVGLSLCSGLYFDDPQDEYAAIIFNIQHGVNADSLQQIHRSANFPRQSMATKSTRTGTTYSGQGISSTMYTNYVVSDKPPRI